MSTSSGDRSTAGAHHPLYGCLLKMRRADEHFNTLQEYIRGFLDSGPYKIIHEPKWNQYIVRVKVHKWPPHEWSPVIGDIVHNTRSTLDHLAWQLVKRNGKEPKPGTTQFPIFSKDPVDPYIYDTNKLAKNALGRWTRQTRVCTPATSHSLRSCSLFFKYQRIPILILSLA
jgi:hypothetical protein